MKVIEFQHVKPGKGGAFVRTKLKDIQSGKIIDETFNAGHKLEFIRVEARAMQFLYVDGDTIFKECPSKAFGIDLEDNVLGGVCDYSHFPKHREKWESKIIPFENANEMYINSGLLLWNLKAPENKKLIEKCKKIEERYPDKLRFNDQDLFNKVFEGKKKIIT